MFYFCFACADKISRSFYLTWWAKWRTEAFDESREPLL